MKYIDKLRKKFTEKWGIGNPNALQPAIKENLMVQFLEEISENLSFMVNLEKSRIKEDLKAKTIKELQECLKEFEEEIKGMKKEDLIDFYILKNY